MSLAQRTAKSLVTQLHSNVPDLAAYRTPPRTENNVQSVPLRIQSATAIGGQDYKWAYSVKIARFAQSTWTWTSAGTLSGMFKAYNGWEAANTATSVLAIGGGDPSDLPSGFSVVPLPTGLITWGHVQYFSDADASAADDFAFFLINEPNPIAGACS